MASNQNVIVQSRKFFNAQTSQDNRSWVEAASAYYRKVGVSDKRNLAQAMAVYFYKLNSGLIPTPIPLLPTQAIVDNAGTVPVQNSAGAAIGNGTAAVANSAVTSVRLPATVAGVANAATLPVQTSAGVSVGKGTVDVASGAVSSVRLPATIGAVSSKVEVTIPDVTFITSRKAGQHDSVAITFVVANGVIIAAYVA